MRSRSPARRVNAQDLGGRGRERAGAAQGSTTAGRSSCALAKVYTLVYTFAMNPTRAKLFQNGGSQAVRLPRECRFPRGASEVIVRRIGRRVVLEPVDELPDQFLESLGSVSGDLPRPKRVPITKVRDPFG
jgi:antitoxin VapB